MKVVSALEGLSKCSITGNYKETRTFQLNLICMKGLKEQVDFAIA